MLVCGTSHAVAAELPSAAKPRKSDRPESCLSWDANGAWCSQSMDEPVVALQLTSQVRKRGSKPNPDQIAAEERMMAEERNTNIEPPHDDGTSFFQMGMTTMPEDFTDASDVDKVRASDTKNTASLGDDEEEDASAISPAPKSAVFVAASSVLTAIDAATGDPRKWGDNLLPHVIIAVSTGVLLFVCYMLVWGGWMNYSRKMYFKCCGRRNIIERLPDKALCPLTIEFREPVLRGASASFGIPLSPLSDSIVERMSFNISERVHGPMLRADITRLKGMDAWAKLEISMLQGSSSKMSPVISCSRVESDAEIESRNVQDAVDSWLSLLVNDKCNDNPEVTGAESCQDNEDSQSEEPHSQSESEQIVKPVSGAKKAKDAKNAESKNKHRPRLQVSDGQGNNLGLIELDPMGRYVYHKGDVKMVIDACRDQHAVVVSEDGRKCAIATGLKSDGSPELAGQGQGEEQADFLQVDTLIDVESPDLMPVLLCVLAPIAFKR